MDHPDRQTLSRQGSALALALDDGCRRLLRRSRRSRRLLTFAVAVLVASMAALATGAAPANAKGPKGNATFIRWETTETVTTPAAKTTLTVTIVDGDGPPPGPPVSQTLAARRARYRYRIRARWPGHNVKRKGDAAEFLLPREGATVRVTVNDRYGARYQEEIVVAGGAHTAIALKSRWTQPTWRGRFVNTSHICPRGMRRTLRFVVTIPGDLYVGRPVKVRAGRAGFGPMLPADTYAIEVQEWTSKGWQIADHSGRSTTLTVTNGKKWRFAYGCAPKRRRASR